MPPVSTGTLSPPIVPIAWNQGVRLMPEPVPSRTGYSSADATWSSTSPPCSSSAGTEPVPQHADCSALTTTLRCGSRTPFDRPVVPPV